MEFYGWYIVGWGYEVWRGQERGKENAAEKESRKEEAKSEQGMLEKEEEREWGDIR